MKAEEEREIVELLKSKLPDKIRKEVKVRMNKAGVDMKMKQYYITLPSMFVEEMNIRGGDIFVIEYDPETKDYSIKLKENQK